MYKNIPIREVSKCVPQQPLLTAPSRAGKTFLNWPKAIKKETGLKLLPFPFLRDALDPAAVETWWYIVQQVLKATH